MRVRPSALIVEEGKALLLHYEYGGVDVYAIPGGSPENSETLEEAVIRELFEELSVSVAVGELVLVLETPPGGQGREPVLHTVFSATVVSGTPLLNPANTSSKGLVRIEINSLAELHMYPDAGKNILDISTGKAQGRGAFIGQIDQRWYE